MAVDKLEIARAVADAGSYWRLRRLRRNTPQQRTACRGEGGVDESPTGDGGPIRNSFHGHATYTTSAHTRGSRTFRVW